MLKMGPAMQPVIAISPNPLLVIATLAFMSPRQLPHARSVSPKSGLGKPRIKPNSCNKSTTISEVKEIHMILITKPRIAKPKKILGGG